MRHLPAVRALLAAGLLGLVATAPLAAQASGRITGRVVDVDQGTPLAGAIVEVVGAATPTRVTAGIDGRYVLLNDELLPDKRDGPGQTHLNSQ